MSSQNPLLEFTPADILYITTGNELCMVKLLPASTSEASTASAIDSLMVQLFAVLTSERAFEDWGM